MEGEKILLNWEVWWINVFLNVYWLFEVRAELHTGRSERTGLPDRVQPPLPTQADRVENNPDRFCRRCRPPGARRVR